MAVQTAIFLLYSCTHLLCCVTSGVNLMKISYFESSALTRSSRSVALKGSEREQNKTPLRLGRAHPVISVIGLSVLCWPLAENQLY